MSAEAEGAVRPLKRPSTPETFAEWFQRYGEPYEAAVIANGGEPWTRDIEVRRALWERRYSRPEPPEGLHRDPRTPETYTEEIHA